MAKYTLKVLSGTDSCAKHTYDRTDLKSYNLTATADSLKDGIRALILKIWMNPVLRPNTLIEKVRMDHGIGMCGQYLVTTRGPSDTAIRYLVSVYNFGLDGKGSVQYTQADGKGKFYEFKL